MKRIVRQIVFLHACLLTPLMVNAQVCTADFFADTNGLDVEFVNQSTGFFTNQFWDFGDGFGYSTDLSPTYTYALSGTYTVCLSIYDTVTSLCYDDLCQDVEVSTGGGGGGGDDCNANFTFETDVLNVYCTNTSTGTFLAAVFDYGDGSTPSFETQHTYAEPGTYEVCLSVTNLFPFCFSQKCKSVTVYQFDCEPMFEYSYNSENNLFNFKNTTEIGNYDEVKWQFGDGNASSFANPSYTYNEPGTYEVCLNTYDQGELCGVGCQLVEVYPLSVNEATINDWKLYPNPNNGFVWLEGLKGEELITVYDLSGKQVYQMKNNRAQSSMSMNLDLAPGVYSLSVLSGASNVEQRMVILD